MTCPSHPSPKHTKRHIRSTKFNLNFNERNPSFGLSKIGESELFFDIYGLTKTDFRKIRGLKKKCKNIPPKIFVYIVTP